MPTPPRSTALETAIPALIGRTVNGIDRLRAGSADRIAFRLFAYPTRRARLQPQQAAVLAQAAREAVPTGAGTAIAYRWGDGARPVVLAHGWESRAGRLTPLVQPLLEAGCSPIAFDAPGHGAAAGRTAWVPHYAELIAELARRHGPLAGAVGHSFGALGVFHAARSGAALPTIVTVNGVAEFDYLVRAFSTRLALRPGIESRLRLRVGRIAFPGIDEPIRRLAATNAQGVAASRILVLQDLDDPVVAPEQAHRLVAAYPERARLVETRGLGHSRILLDLGVQAEIAAALRAGGA